jgi:sugar lactone lactonase YvrE
MTDAAATPDWTLVIDGIDFGEGPRWHDGRLWFSDFFQQTISSVEIHADGSGTRHVELEHHERPSGLGWLPDGRLVFVSMIERKVLRREPDGSVVVHAELADAATGNCNDMVVGVDGTIYVGNFGFDFEAGDEPRPTRLSVVRPDGSVDVHDHLVFFPNGSVITADDTTLIVGETMGSKYTAFAIDADGNLGAGSTWADVPGMFPDGCTLDAAGGIWFSDALGKQVVRVIEGGEITHRLATPDNTYACMLGGDDGATLFVLTGAAADPELARGTATGTIVSTRVEHPRAGRP